jgi:hypothetical protein
MKDGKFGSEGQFLFLSNLLQISPIPSSGETLPALAGESRLDRKSTPLLINLLVIYRLFA